MAKEETEKAFLAKIRSAINSRVQHFKDQSDSVTLESVRRLLEKDLGLETYALDSHKKFIRTYLESKMDDDFSSKATPVNVDEEAHLSEKEVAELHTQHEVKKDSKKTSSEDEKDVEGSTKRDKEPKVDAQNTAVSESMIAKAILGRADHFISNSENITLGGVRRLLEKDLGLDMYALDPFKKFISMKIDQVLSSSKTVKSTNNAKKNLSESSRSKKSDNIDRESSESQDKANGTAPRRKEKSVEGMKKRKPKEEPDTDISSKKKNKLAKRQKEEDNDSEDGSASEDGQSRSSVEKPNKEKSATVYGKQVEHLKSIIKACGMSVAPSIYKKGKQVPDNKREAFIVKELEGILSKEGLSKNPSEKEIKDCRKRKERQKELEGIDMSNIISSSRRRSTSTFMAPPDPKIRADSNKKDSEGHKKKEDDKKDQNDDNEKEKEAENEEVKEEEEEDEEEEDDEEEEEDSQSEEFNEEEEESD